MFRAFIRVILFLFPLNLSARSVFPGFGITGLWGINMFGTEIEYSQGGNEVYTSSFSPGHFSNIGIFFNLTRENNEKMPSSCIDLHIAIARKVFCVNLLDQNNSEGNSVPYHFCKFNIKGFDMPLLLTIFFSSGPYISVGWILGMGYFMLIKGASYETSIPKKIPQKATKSIMDRGLSRYNVCCYLGLSLVFLDQITKMNILYSLSLFNNIIDDKDATLFNTILEKKQSNSKVLRLKEIFGEDSILARFNHSITLQLQINCWRIIQG